MGYLLEDEPAKLTYAIRDDSNFPFVLSLSKDEQERRLPDGPFDKLRANGSDGTCVGYLLEDGPAKLTHAIRHN